MSLTPVNTQLYPATTLYVNGLGLLWVSNTKITVSAGAARDTSNEQDITLATAVTINAATTGANALDTGTLAASTMYAVWIVGDSSQTNPTCAQLSLSFTQPTVPFGYDMARRIGAVYVDGSTHIALFWQQGAESAGGGTNGASRWMFYDTAIATGITAGASTSYAAVNLENTVPATASIVRIEAALTPNAARDAVYLQPYGGTGAATVFSGSVTGGANLGMLDCPVGVNATPAPDLKYKVTSASDAVALNVQGYLDEL